MKTTSLKVLEIYMCISFKEKKKEKKGKQHDKMQPIFDTFNNRMLRNFLPLSAVDICIQETMKIGESWKKERRKKERKVVRKRQ